MSVEPLVTVCNGNMQLRQLDQTLVCLFVEAFSESDYLCEVKIPEDGVMRLRIPWALVCFWGV